jgi:hypothetical protein
MLVVAGCGPAEDDEASRQPVRAASDPAGGFCRVGMPASWRRALTAGRLAERAGETLTVHAVGTDGHTAVADSTRGRTRSVVFLHDGTRRTVLRLAHPARDQLYGAAYDGRYLVFSVGHDPANLSAWTLYAWDSWAGGAPEVLARNAVDASGHPVDSPLLYPVVAGGRAAWTAGIADGRDQLHRYDLATGTDEVVRTGHPGTPFLVGGDLVWPESPAPDALTRLHAVGLASGRPVTLPAVLAGIRGPAFIAGGTGTAAWVGPQVRTLRVWRAGWSHPVRVLTGRNIQWVRVAGPLVTWDNGAAQFAADLRSGSYTRLTTAYGYTVAAGDALAVGYPPSGKTGAAPAPTVVDADTLPALSGC